MGKIVEKSEPVLTAGNVKWCSCCRKQCGGSSAAIESRNPTFGYTPKRMEARTQIDICTPMFTAALFQPAKRWKQPKGPSATDKWINKIWSVDTLGCYSGLKCTGILTHATARINLEDIRSVK